ncbi:MAG TPA: hypothetical protein VHG89_06485 [Verrucomicrobiae bacterium]|nr:hypothetical protein [Verrucomicrobiae bacterium]
MTRDEAKNILLLYRPGTADAQDAEIAAALALVKQDAELSRWLEQHCARQEMLRSKFQQISAPAGLKEQITSERAVQEQKVFHHRALVFTTAAVMAILIGLFIFFRQQPPSDDTFANYRSRMVSTALRGYSMDFESADLKQIRDYLAQQKAPADYDLPAGLQKIAASGCAVEDWQSAKVSMICFQTGKPLSSGEKSDLWLFVVDRASIKNLQLENSPQFIKVNKLTTATWTRGDKLYLLGTFGDEQTIHRYL